MLHLCGRKLYVSVVHGEPAGVFSTHEKARACAHDSVSEIEPYFLEGSPVCEGYVFLAKGSAVMLIQDGAFSSSRHFELGPVWGVNAQSAVAALCSVPEKRKNVLPETFLLFEIDKACSDVASASVRGERPFTFLTNRIYDWDELPEEAIRTDYLAQYLDLQRKEAKRRLQEEERRRLRNSSEMRFVCDCMIHILLDSHPALIAPYADNADFISSVYQAFSHTLSDHFTHEEFDRLTAALRAQSADDENALLIDKAGFACRLELELLQNPGSKFLRMCRRLI